MGRSHISLLFVIVLVIQAIKFSQKERRNVKNGVEQYYEIKSIVPEAAAQQVVIQTRCSVYNVDVSKKREQEGMKVGNDFGTLFIKMIPANSVTNLNPDPQHGMGQV